ncbi:Cytochrome b [Priestia megaterium]
MSKIFMKAVKYAVIRIIIHIYEWWFMKPRYSHGFLYS